MTYQSETALLSTFGDGIIFESLVSVILERNHVKIAIFKQPLANTAA